MTYTVWDVETTIKTYMKRKASPFCLDNYIVASGFKRKEMVKATAHYFGRVHPSGDWFREMLNGTKILVGFNIKFDLLHAIRDPDNYSYYMEWVADGGRVWDCQVAEYLLHGMAQEHQMLALDEVAPRYGGHLKNDAVKALWEAGIDTPEIDKDLLLEYLIGSGEPSDLGDIGNTEKVFLGQVQALRARGGIASALLNMDSLLCTIEMERNGMHVDKARGLELAAALEIKLTEYRAEMSKSLPADLPFEFNWKSRFHLSALVFGGDIKYKAKALVLDDEGNPTYYQKKETQWVLDSGETTNEPPHNSARILDYVTYAGGKNKGEYKTKQVTVPDLERGPKDRYEDFLYRFAGYTQPEKKWESSTEGVYSVAADVIAELGGRNIPFLDQLALVAGLAKDLGTYYITTDEDGNQKGMLTLVGPDGLVHHRLNHTSTVTGRFSSSDPNLQNVSGAGKSDVKSIFTSRFKGGWVIQSDFTALEIYVQAILTMAKQLIADLKLGLDMHIVRLAQKLGRDYDEVYALYKAGDKDIAKQRKGSKEFSFQRAYGAGVAAIAASTGMAVEDIEALILAEAERYPEVEAFYVKLTELIQSRRTPTNRFVEHPDIRGMTCQLGRSYHITPDGKMYSYSEHPAPEWIAKKPASRGGVAQSFSPPEIKNYIVQGTGGEWAKAAMALALRSFYAFKNFGGLALLVNQVHDALYGDSDPSVGVRAAALIHACMEEASAYMEYTFKWKIPVPVPTETKYGSSMIEELDMPDGFKEQVKAMRTWVRDKYMPGFVPSFEETT